MQWPAPCCNCVTSKSSSRKTRIFLQAFFMRVESRMLFFLPKKCSASRSAIFLFYSDPKMYSAEIFTGRRKKATTLSLPLLIQRGTEFQVRCSRRSEEHTSELQSPKELV